MTDTANKKALISVGKYFIFRLSSVPSSIKRTFKPLLPSFYQQFTYNPDAQQNLCMAISIRLHFRNTLFRTDLKRFCWDIFWVGFVHRVPNKTSLPVHFFTCFGIFRWSACSCSTTYALYASVKCLMKNRQLACKNYCASIKDGSLRKISASMLNFLSIFGFVVNLALHHGEVFELLYSALFVCN